MNDDILVSLLNKAIEDYDYDMINLLIDNENVNKKLLLKLLLQKSFGFRKEINKLSNKIQNSNYKINTEVKSYITNNKPLDISLDLTSKNRLNSFFNDTKTTFKDVDNREGFITIINFFKFYYYKNCCIYNYILILDFVDKIDNHRNIEDFRIFINNCNLNLIISLVGIIDEEGGHANLLIINKENNIIFRYDPSNFYIKGNFVSSSVTNQIDDILTNSFEQYIYKTSSELCPLQLVEDQHDTELKNIIKDTYKIEGYCFTFALLFMHISIENPDLDPNEINNLLLNNPEQLALLIRNYAGFIHEIGRQTSQRMKLKNEIINRSRFSRRIKRNLKRNL